MEREPDLKGGSDDSDDILIGIRRAGKIQGSIEYYTVLRAIRAIERSDVALLIIDAADGIKADETGLLLYYDGDTADGKQSMGGGGHVIQFRAPQVKWRLDAVCLYGSRYGTPEPPAEDFSIFVCDAAMNVIADIRQPYSLFERGPEK